MIGRIPIVCATALLVAVACDDGEPTVNPTSGEFSGQIDLGNGPFSATQASFVVTYAP